MNLKVVSDKIGFVIYWWNDSMQSTRTKMDSKNVHYSCSCLYAFYLINELHFTCSWTLHWTILVQWCIEYTLSLCSATFLQRDVNSTNSNRYICAPSFIASALDHSTAEEQSVIYPNSEYTAPNQWNQGKKQNHLVMGMVVNTIF